MSQYHSSLSLVHHSLPFRLPSRKGLLLLLRNFDRIGLENRIDCIEVAVYIIGMSEEIEEVSTCDEECGLADCTAPSIEGGVDYGA